MHVLNVMLWLTGLVVWVIGLVIVAKPIGYALVATASFGRCMNAVIRRHQLKASRWRTLGSLGSNFVAFCGNPTPGNITMSGDYFYWGGIGNWRVRTPAEVEAIQADIATGPARGE